MRTYLALTAAMGLLLNAVTLARPPAEKTPAVETCIVTGKGISRSAALNDALRQAVQRGVGTLVYTESRVRDFVLTRDTILTRAQGYVEKTEILSPAREVDGVWEVKIRAVVSLQRIGDMWARVKILLARMGRPKIMVFLTERIQPKVSPLAGQLQPDSTAQTRTENLLLKSGFDLVDKRQIMAIRQKDLADAAAASDPEKVRAIAKRFKAQIFVTGSTNAVNSGQSKAFEVRLQNYGSDGDVKCYRSDTARLLSSQNGVGESSDLNPRRAAKKSLWQLGDVLGGKVRTDILRFWLDVMEHGDEIQLEVGNITHGEATQLAKVLGPVKGVVKANVKEYHNGIAMLAVEARMTAGELAEQLRKLVENLNITDTSQNVIKGRIKKD